MASLTELSSALPVPPVPSADRPDPTVPDRYRRPWSCRCGGDGCGGSQTTDDALSAPAVSDLFPPVGERPPPLPRPSVPLMSVCLRVVLSVCLWVSLSVGSCVRLSACLCLHVCMYVCMYGLSMGLSLSVSVRMSVCPLSVCESAGPYVHVSSACCGRMGAVSQCRHRDRAGGKGLSARPAARLTNYVIHSSARLGACSHAPRSVTVGKRRYFHMFRLSDSGVNSVFTPMMNVL